MVCNSLLRNTGRQWTEEMLRRVLKFKRLHLKQQQDARLRLALDIEEAKSARDVHGQPKVDFIVPDGVSVWLGNTVKDVVGKRADMDDSKIVENRTIGVDVVSVDIEGKFLYHFNNFYGHGANIMIEVVRQAQEDFSRLVR